VLAKDKKEHVYQVGTVQSAEDIGGDTIGTGAGCGLAGCTSGTVTQLSNKVTYVHSESGDYAIHAPTSAVGGFALGMMTGGAPTVHVRWFLDDVKKGDKVLFYAECNKHNDCRFWIPKPDQQGKEYTTSGRFIRTTEALKDNSKGLCGTGKLTPAAEAQMCNQQAPTVPEQTPAATSGAVPNTSTSAIDSQTALYIPAMTCEKLAPQIPYFQSGQAGLPLTWAAIQAHCPREAGTVVPKPAAPTTATPTPTTPIPTASSAAQRSLDDAKKMSADSKRLADEGKACVLGEDVEAYSACVQANVNAQVQALQENAQKLVDDINAGIAEEEADEASDPN
jgi:hypothetical protein